ncbi:Tol-Pal system protein TolB [Helicobacter muridarum]|uniref:Protein tolB n=1 Tax=Helicobacter muridarum TaxID=216 RepID=A0A377PX01_9HELI|nr:Tol-Pal system protein TolB [Helicobacter muridarum]TLE01297.1 Tol-Pal system protein TolB [Helicobacter muridarum]STQ87165.1 protein tolB precursor [Helicobacter muridarum]
MESICCVLRVLFLYGLLQLISFSYANDKTITITAQIQNTPNIQVVSSDNNENTIKIYKMLIQDLRVLGHFNTYYDDTVKTNVLKYDISIQDYKAKNIHFIAQVSHKKDGNKFIGILTLRDLVTDREETTEYIQEDKEAYPFISHTMAVYLSKYIKADNADWINRYVIFSKQIDSTKTEIAIADYTFTYQKTLISNGINVFPKWANKEQSEFYYTSINNEATIYRYNLSNSKNQRVLSSQGMAIVSDVSRDGSKVLMSLSPVGLSDIFLYDVKARKVVQLTTYSGIDVNAGFINNDKSFAFVSDRLGYPNIFVQDLYDNGYSRVSQAVFRGRNNSMLATFQDYIVFSSRETNPDTGSIGFNLYLISSQSDYMRKLSKTGVNRMPRFSYDGDSIMFLKQSGGESAIGIIRLSINKSFLFPLKSLKIQAFDW